MSGKIVKYIVILFAIFIVMEMVGGYFLDYEWFSSYSAPTTFWILFMTKFKVLFAFGLLFFLLFSINLFMMYLFGGRDIFDASGILGRFSSSSDSSPRSKLIRVVITISLMLSFLFGFSAAVNWEDFLLFFNRIGFPENAVDPIFGKNVSFYVFTLPLLRFIYVWIWWAVIVLMLFSLGYHLLNKMVRLTRGNVEFSSHAKAHLLSLGFILLVLFGLGYRLDSYDLLFLDRGKFFGAGYTAAHAQLNANNICMWVMFIASALIFVSIIRKKYLSLLVIIAVVFGTIIVVGKIYPFVQQRFVVLPNELDRELPYIENNIKNTLAAYGLDGLKEVNFKNNTDLTVTDLTNNSSTVENIRLWDWQPLNQTYKQLQELKPYYQFFDVDVDRYVLDGNLRAVNIAARELDIRELSSNSQSWINKHLVYTHGYGFVMNRVDRVTTEGLPEILVKDIPPKASIPVTIERPEVYYGENENPYVITNTNIKPGEFDYPSGETNSFTTYSGNGGIKIDTFFKKLMFSFALGDLNLLISDNITEKSRLHYMRNINDIVNELTPYLEYDYDPYVVCENGRLYWIMDAFTVTDRYPYSTISELGDRDINYIRNSVKIVIDAYEGKASYYVIDKNDPLIRVYSSIFTDIFKDYSEMPDYLKKHVRYSESLFNVQTGVLLRYHMTNPNVFYNNEDLWALPVQTEESSNAVVPGYYIVTKLPNSDKTEFVLMQPLTPVNKNNMIGFVVAKCDAENYGKLELFRLPKEKLNYGPMQMEARINQDAEISKQLTLWSQKGSKVIKGNIYTIPIKDSILYVEALYLKAESSEMPELKRVIVSYADRIVMEDNLSKALSILFGGDVTVKTPPDAAAISKPDSGVPSSVKESISKANAHFSTAEKYLKEGNWAGYGEEMKKVKEILESLK